MAHSPLLLSALALLGTVILITLLKRPAQSLGLTDQPGHRKHHQGAIPLVGGIAMMLMLMVLLPWVSIPQGGTLAPMLALGIITVVGAVDDAQDLSPKLRLIPQLLAGGLILSIGGTQLVDLGGLLGTASLPLGWLAIPFTLFCVVGVINALNMMDGMDGLAGGTALIATGWLALLVWLAGQPSALPLLALLAAVLVGFLGFNLRHPWRQRAAVFMGDAGSMGLGFLLAWLLIQFSQGETRAIAPITAVWLLGLPLMDTVSIVIRRKRRGLSPFAADRHHLHHLFHRYGFSDGQTTALMLSVSLLLGAVGVAGEYWQVPEALMHLGFWGLFIAYHQAMQRLWHELDQPKPVAAERVQTLNSVAAPPVAAPLSTAQWRLPSSSQTHRSTTALAESSGSS